MASRKMTFAKVLGVVALVVVLVGAVLWFRCGLRGCPDVDLLRGYMPDEASVVLDREGEEVGKLYLTRRVVVPLDSLPEHVPQAFIAVEDRRFYEHGGVDWPRVGGAVIANVRAGGVAEGFSTITMQLSRNLFPEQLPAAERTIFRKIGEMRVAGQIESRYGKNEILELYLNQIYFGAGAWGIQAAAQEYFGKDASELTLAEAALLAALPVAPSRLNPRANPEAARERRDLVLSRMEEAGFIDRGDAEAAREAEVRVVEARAPDAVGAAPYFMEEVRQRLEDVFGRALYTEGYRIHTTLDAGVQRAAETELERQLRQVEAGQYGRFRGTAFGEASEEGGQRRSTDYLQGAVVVLEVSTGDVLALVGGRNFNESPFNRATQAYRQAGSAFKPFVYAAAIARGYPPTYRLEDTPIRRVMQGGQVWEPRNYGGEFSGSVSLREALTYSKNIPTVLLSEQVGVDEVVRTAERMGLQGHIPNVPAVVLGAAEVTLIDLVAAYAAFASLGRRPDPRFVTRVEDRLGQVVWSESPDVRRVIDSDVAFLVTNLLQDVVDRGTATAVRGVGFRGAVAGKTGTTNEATDTWFIGYTPSHAAGVWVGFDEPRTVVPGATGGELAAPVWGRVMRRVSGGGSGGWAPPAGVEQRQVDAAGNVLALGCPPQGEIRNEYFLRGTGNVGYCAYPDYAYGDTLYPELLPDSLEEEEGWFARFRRRWLERNEGEDPDTARVVPLPGEAPPPSAGRLGGDTLVVDPPEEEPEEEEEPELEEPRSPPELLGEPAPRVRIPDRR